MDLLGNGAKHKPQYKCRSDRPRKSGTTDGKLKYFITKYAPEIK